MKNLLLAALAALALTTSAFPHPVLFDRGADYVSLGAQPSSSAGSASSSGTSSGSSASSSGGSSTSSGSGSSSSGGSSTSSGSGSSSSGSSSSSQSQSGSGSGSGSNSYSSSSNSAQPLSPIQKITSAGNQRSFFYYQPANFNTSLGMLLALHGGGGSGYSFAKGSSQSLWLDLADRTGLLVLFPNGKPRPGDARKRTWNTCMQDSRSNADNWDDVQFMRDLVSWTTANIGPVDTKRVYAAGESEGGWLTQRLALEANDLIAAGADFAANLPVSNDSGTYKCAGYTAPYTPGTEVPMFFFKGNADPRLNYGAVSGPDATEYCEVTDSSATAPCSKGAFYSFYSTIAFWQWKLGLKADSSLVDQAAATNTIQYADTVPDCTSSVASCDGSIVTRYEYGSSPATIVFDLANGGGHRFPGPNPETQAKLNSLGWQNRDQLGQPNPYAAEEAWAFLSQFSR